jgi:hypothetical protein
MPTRWARVRKTGAHGLRRGAWYTVVNDSKPTIVFLDVNRKSVAMDRTLLEFREQPPTAWSVVTRAPDEPRMSRSGRGPFPATYAVCPQCRARADVEDGVAEMHCGYCDSDYPVDWENPC